MGFPSRGILSVVECFLEPGAVRNRVVRPVDCVTQLKDPVDDLWAEGGVLFGGEVSREAQGGFPVVHIAKGGVNRRG